MNVLLAIALSWFPMSSGKKYLHLRKSVSSVGHLDIALVMRRPFLTALLILEDEKAVEWSGGDILIVSSGRGNLLKLLLEFFSIDVRIVEGKAPTTTFLRTLRIAWHFERKNEFLE